MHVFQKKNKIFKKLAIIFTLMILVSNLLPSLGNHIAYASAAKPMFEKNYTYSYVGKTRNYMMLNVQKGFTIQWTISDNVAGYVSFSKTDKTQITKNVSVTGKTSGVNIYTTNAAYKKLGDSYTVSATVYDTNGTAIITCTDKVTISIDSEHVTIKNAPANNTLYVNQSFNFNRRLSPTYSTNKTFWIIHDVSGKEIVNTKTGLTSKKVSMTSNGIFTPKTTGTFYISARVYRSKFASILRAVATPIEISVIDIPTVTPTVTPIATPTVTPTITPSITPTISPSVAPTSAPIEEEICISFGNYIEGVVYQVVTDTVTLTGNIVTNTNIAEVSVTYYSSTDESIKTFDVDNTNSITLSSLPLDLGMNYVTITAVASNGATSTLVLTFIRVSTIGMFSGTVFASDFDRDNTNNPVLVGAKIIITNTESSTELNTDSFEMFTDNNGSFGFTNVPSGVYKLEILMEGYITFINDNYFISENPNALNVYLDLNEISSSLSGTITEADEDMDASNNIPLSNIMLTINKIGSSTTPVMTAITDNSGNYTFNSLPIGLYEISVVDNNYIPVKSEILITSSNTTFYNITLEAISNNYSGEGTATGTIYNSLSGGGVEEGLTLTVYSGYNMTTGEIVTTTTTTVNGYYTLTLPAGNYTVYIKDNRIDAITKYRDGFFNVKILGNKTISNQNGDVTPVLGDGEIRIVLTWGQTPDDLDSHLTGPTSGINKFHTYYRNQTYSENNLTMVALDVDDTTSYGPETTTIYYQLEGIYKFSVHDYTNRDQSYSMALANSSACVKVYMGVTSIVTYYVPYQAGTVWDVFEYNSITGVLTILNTMYYHSNPGTIGAQNINTMLAMWNYDDEYLYDTEQEEVYLKEYELLAY